MSTTIITITEKEHGQPRAYADSFYSGWITMFKPDTLTPDEKGNKGFFIEMNEAQVKAIARLFIRPFVEKDEDRSWASPRLLECRKVGPTPEMKAMCREKWQPKEGSRWFARITEVYTD